LARPSDAAARPPVTSVADERIPLRGLRRKIAQKMQQSKNTAAHFTYVDEVDMTELVALRERSRRAAEERGVRLTYLPFIAKAVVAALRRFPMLNATLDDEKGEIVVRRSYHLGIAVATDDGLIVPVLRDADQKNLFELGREIDALGEKARTGKLAPGEASGSTFTITSLGKLGGLFATPIINHPEVAILGVHEIKKRPVVVEGQIVIRDIMLLSVSFDHRLIDGHVGAAFAQQVKSYLEDPHLLFLALA
jgi:pyruvate dehydrogenase E2 component (dihydrolipoamide acetyltransferase)